MRDTRDTTIRMTAKKSPGCHAGGFVRSPEGTAQNFPCERRHRRNLSVAKGTDALHPIGHPIRSSTQQTVGQQPVAVSTLQTSEFFLAPNLVLTIGSFRQPGHMSFAIVRMTPPQYP